MTQVVPRTDPDTPLDVRSSRYLRLPVAAAIGGILSVAALVLVFLGPLVDRIGTNTPSGYLLALVFFLPVVLSLAETAFFPGEPGGLFHLARSRNRLQASFLIGWLLIGGLTLLGAGLAIGAADYLARLATVFLDTQIPVVWVRLGLVVLVTLNQWPRSMAAWPRRAILLYFSLGALALLLLWARVAPPAAIQGYAYLPPRDPIGSLQILVIGLWGLHFILEHQRFLRGGVWHGVATLAGSGLMSSLAGWAAAATLIGFPLLFSDGRPPLVALAAAAGPVWEVAALGLALLLILSALDVVVASALRLVAEMAEVRFLPPGAVASSADRTAGRPLLALSLAMAAATLLPLGQTMAGSAAAISGGLVILLAPRSLRRGPERRRGRPFLLPLYPLFPAAAALICLAVLLGLPATSLLMMIGWLALGEIYFLARARRAAILQRQQQEIVSDRPPPSVPSDYRLLVGVANPDTAVPLLRAGATLARARRGDLLALRIIEASEQMPAIERHRQARRAWDELQAWVRQADLDPSLPFLPLVRFAPTIGEGLASTLWEESIDTLVLGWPAHPGRRRAPADDTLDAMVRSASCEVLVLRGELPTRPAGILVPLVGEAHAPAALAAARDLGAGRVVALRAVAGPTSTERQGQLESELRQSLERLEPGGGAEGRVVAGADARQVIADSSGSFDLTILGVSDEGFLSPTGVRGLPQAVAERTQGPLLLIKRREVVHQFWLRRAWEQLNASLPTLTRDRQATVGIGIRQGARAGIDFYMMIVLSSLLAAAGLLLNSAAVIIGAMLVAPLLSPILGIAHGVVRGDLRVVRQAANSTLNGVVLAIALPAALTLFLPVLGFPSDPTPEILARTQPTLLDLLVAFVSGLAAAYAISREEVGAALPGVAIAAALVPPLAASGYGLGSARFGIATGALLLFLANLAAIVLAGTVMFLLLGIRPPARADRGERVREALVWIGLAIAVISIPLALTTAGTSRRLGLQERVEEVLGAQWNPADVGVVAVSVSTVGENTEVHLTLYDHHGSLRSEDIQGLAGALSRALSRPVTVDYIIIPVEAGQVAAATATPTPSPTPTPTPRPSPSPVPTAAP